MIDTHVHFWNYDKVKDAWITEEMKLLQKDFLPQHLIPVLEQNKVEGIIAVQADQSEKETAFLSELASRHPQIKGIVGWVDFQNENIDTKLSLYSQSPIIKGFRHIVEAEPEGFLLGETFQNGIKLLKNYNFTYDLLIHEDQIEEAVAFVNNFPKQKFIIDHCAKPNIKSKSNRDSLAPDSHQDGWKKGMQEISKNENVYCKISGLTTEANWNTWKEEAIYPYLDIVFDSFGKNRVLIGSDWPVMLLSSTYSKWKNLLENYMRDFSKEEKRKVFRENAIEFYNLNADINHLEIDSTTFIFT